MRSFAVGVLLVCAAFTSACGKNVDAAAAIPAPAVDEQRGAASDRFAVFAGGCFWGIEAVF